MIEIIKWSDCFESADTRKRQRLGWFLSPSGCDSRGYRQLMRMGDDGLIALGVFQALCQSMATQPMKTRQSGIFAHGDGTMMEIEDILELSRITGRQVADYRQVIGRLVSVGWIYLHKSLDLEQSATCLPPVCQSSPGFVQGEGEGQGEEKGKEEDPPNPPRGNRGGGDRLPTSEEAIRISTLFRRRLTTPWTPKEIKAFKAILPVEKDDLDLVCRYTEKERDKGEEGRHRRDLATFLNNFHGELDRAKQIFGSSRQRTTTPGWK